MHGVSVFGFGTLYYGNRLRALRALQVTSPWGTCSLRAPLAIFTIELYMSLLWVTSQYRVIIACVLGRVSGRVAFPGVWSRELGAPPEMQMSFFDCQR